MLKGRFQADMARKLRGLKLQRPGGGNAKEEDQLTALSGNSLNFIKLSHLSSSLDVLEMNIRVFAKVDNTSQVVEETLGRLVLLKEIDQSGRAQ